MGLVPYKPFEYMYLMTKERRVYAPNRIRELRKAKGLSQEDVIERMGGIIQPSALSKLEKSQMGLTLGYMIEIAKALGVPHEALVREMPPTRILPILGTIAAGDWREMIEDPQGWLPMPADVGGINAFVLYPQGDSMDKVIDDNGFIVVDPDQLDLIDGKYYTVRNADGEATFKQYRSDPPRLEPCSTNPSHTTIAIGREPFTVIGRVVFAGHTT